MIKPYKIGFWKSIFSGTITEQKADICNWIIKNIELSNGKWVVKENLVFIYDEFDGILCFANEKKNKFENKSIKDMERYVLIINKVIER